MTDKSMTYLQFKATADQLAHAGKTVTPDQLFDLLNTISTQAQIKQYFDRWVKEHEAETPIDTETSRTMELEKSLSITRATLESTADAILIIDNQGRITDFNQKFLDVTEIPPEIIESGTENEGLGYLLTLLENPEELVSQIQYLMQHPEEVGDMGDVHFKNGKIVERYSQPHRIGKEIVGRVWSFRDVTAQRQQEELLRLSNRAITASTHGIILIANDNNHTVTSVNPASLNLFGVTEDAIINKNFLKTIDCFKEYEHELSDILQKEKKGSLVISCQIQSKPKWFEVTIDPVTDREKKAITHFVAIVNDVSKNKELENILKYKAVHDTLTGLPNKSYLEDAVKYRVQKSPNEEFALLFIDIDRFKNINDTLGHRVGDKLLSLFGNRMRHHVQKKDIIARVGGDEFIIFLDEVKNKEDLHAISERLLTACRRKFKEGDHEFNITASVGVVTYPDCGQDPDTLIRNADIAMYQAKQTGRNKVCFYTRSLNQTMSRRVEIENQLHSAIQQNEFELYYQPIFDLKTQKFTKAESLIRWNSKKLGLVSPNEFIPVAEDIGIMTHVGRWVIEDAARQMNEWSTVEIMKDLAISVNVSPKQLLDEYFVRHLNQTLDKNNIATNKIILELTESFFLLEAKVPETLASLSQLGLHLSIDDFGTGYSNLGYLNKLHISYLKIDKSFIDQIEYESFNDSVLLAILAMAQQMEYGTIAEGVETQKQVEFLKAHNCDQIQGYFYSKPLRVEDFKRFILENNKK